MRGPGARSAAGQHGVGLQVGGADEPDPAGTNPASPGGAGRPSGPEPDGHQQVAVVGLLVGRWLAGDQGRLAPFGEGHAGGVGVDRGQPVEQVGRVEGDLQVVPFVAGVEDLDRLRLVPAAGLEHQLAGREGEPDRGVALGHQGDPLDRLGERRGGQLGDRGHVTGQERLVAGEVAAEQAGGGAAAAALETDHALTGGAVLAGQGQGDRDLRPGGERASGLRQRPGRDQHRGAQVRPGRVPPQLAHGQPVPVGGHQGERVALDLDPHAGQGRERVVTPGRGRRLVHRGGEGVAADGAGRRRHLRQGGVVLDRHREQREGGAAAGQGGAGAVGRDLHRAGGKAAGDLGEQPPRHQRGALLLGGHRDAGLGGYVVVEAGQRELGVGLQAHAGQDGDSGACREPAGGPGDGLGERVALHLDLHRKLPPVT